MSFAADLAGPSLPLAIEITPPRESKPDILLRRASLFRSATSVVNIIQRPDRQSSLDASCELQAAGFEPVLHLVARGATAAGLEAELERAALSGVENVLCILGDASGEAAMKVRDLVAAAARALPAAQVGATFNQYVENPERALENLFGKLHAGATFVETQPAFDAGALEACVAETRREAPGTRFVAMVMPITTPDALKRMEGRLRISAPEAFRRRIAAGLDEAWRAFSELLADLKRSGLVDGVALMTPDMDPEPAQVGRILAAMASAGVGQGGRLE